MENPDYNSAQKINNTNEVSARDDLTENSILGASQIDKEYEGSADVDSEDKKSHNEDSEPQRDGLQRIHFQAYAVSHVQNDLCASMWFIYLSYYLIHVVRLPDNIAALALLSGQITDGIITPTVGYFSDKCKCPGGQRNFWYMAGSALVLPSFFCIFTSLPFVSDNPTSPEATAWYCTFPAVFNVGWASVQIATMAIVNGLSYSQRRRDKMVNSRNGLTYGANITILTMALILFSVTSNSKWQFRIMTCVALSIGVCTTIFYIATIKETRLVKQADHFEEQYNMIIGKKPKDKTIKGKSAGDWLKQCQFYIFGLVYMFARIALNVTATIIPLYLVTVTEFHAPANKGADATPYQVALVPLVQYVSSLIFSLFAMAKVTQYFRNRLIPLYIAVVVTTVGSLPFAFLSANTSINWLVYPLAGLQGIGLALMLNTGTSLISDVIGNDTGSSAFVYGVYSFLDKFANGFLLYWLVAQYANDAHALKWILAIVPTAAAIGTALSTYIGMKMFADTLQKISSGSLLNKARAEKLMEEEQVALGEVEANEASNLIDK